MSKISLPFVVPLLCNVRVDLYPLFFCVAFILLLICENSFYILDINPLLTSLYCSL